MNPALLLARAKEARHQSGKSLIAQLLEILSLRKSVGRIGPSEYFDYRLFDDDKHDPLSKRKFVGWSVETSINDKLNKLEWAALSLDKIVFYTFLEGAGIPYPRIQAIFSTNDRFLKGTPTFTSPESLALHLRTGFSYPVFAKPSHGNFGRGCYFLANYDHASDSVLFRDGSRSLISDFTHGLETKLSGGYIFQEVFTPHPYLVDVCGPRSCTLRVVVVINGRGPRLLWAVWKIPTGDNVIDNFKHGRTGNLVASVDVENGDVQRVIGGAVNGEFVQVTYHPDTGKPLYPLTIPGWQAIEDLCLSAARVISGFRLLHFDIALAKSGPSLLEVNLRGNMDLLQHASGKGFFSDELNIALKDQDAFREEIKEIIRRTSSEREGKSGA